jgi:hypothetical protein
MLTALAATPAVASLNMNEGQWETTLTADGQIQSSNSRCYTRADSVNYTMTCRLGDDEQTSAVSATYRGDSAVGTIRAAGVTVTASSKRTGNCTESSFAR